MRRTYSQRPHSLDREQLSFANVPCPKASAFASSLDPGYCFCDRPTTLLYYNGAKTNNDGEGHLHLDRFFPEHLL